jgi:Plasmid pRiA4b ORF-3-like protein
MATHFSEQPILRDFDRFLTYICDRPALQLTNDKAMLKGPDLLALNEQMVSFKSEMVTNKHHQIVFTLLNTFFFIAQKADLIYVIQNEKNSKNQLFFREENIRKYDALSDDEKYMALLEGFWCQIDWDHAYDCRSFWSNDFYQKLVAKPIGKKITLSDRDLKRTGEMQAPVYPFFAEVLSAFGLWSLTWDDALVKRISRYGFPYKDITLNHLGSVIVPILFVERPRYMWSDYGQWDFFDDDDNDDDETTPTEKFENAFTTSFEGLTIEKHLFERAQTFVAGTYYFKVALDKKIYRVIAIGANDSFDDLHEAIQDAFDFYNDHLYAFFMDGRRWSQGSDVFWSPNNNEGIFADEVQIGEAKLIEGKTFLYLYDFGSEWHFKVTVKAINTEEKPPKKPKVIESVGESPEQYGDDEEEED